jgi:hypothetical protein
MDLGAIFLLLGVLLAVALFLAAPLMGRAIGGSRVDTRELSTLMAQRDRVISALQELDFDYKLGKIPEEDYPIQRSGLLQEGAEVLRSLDQLAPSTSAAGVTDPGSRIEEAAAARRADGSRTLPPLGDDRIETMLAARRAARRAKGAGFCPRCGKPVLTTDQFCPNCGKALG